jgi:ribonuclease D
MFCSLLKFFRRKFVRFPQAISKEDINLLPTKHYEGEIKLISSYQDAKLASKEIELCKIIGFDTESKPSFHKGEHYLPSLIQIATDKAVYIFQIEKIGGLQTLKPIFKNQNILKVGIAIRDDVLKLKEIEKFTSAGFVDISDLTKQLGIKVTGLRNLTAIFFNFKISKSSQVTDWSQPRLSQKQLVYAATDAWISRKLYLKVRKFI